jgi:hypothetical protein
MKDLALQDSQRPEVRDLAQALQSPQGIDQFFRTYWLVTPDPEDAEFIRAPFLQVSEALYEGDCDDAATLAASLCSALGQSSSLVAIRMHYEEDFSHVWCRANLDEDYFLDIDPIVPASALPLVNGVSEVMEVRVL